MYIKSNWKDKERRAQKAIQHTKDCERLYAEQIKECVNNTKTYSPDYQFSPRTNPKNETTEIIVFDTDSVSAILNEKSTEGKIAVLNFASYKNPGGMFTAGSGAQEECLCHESFLYNVLYEKQDYYDWNAQHKNRAMYVNRALYTPDIMFERDGDTVLCDVITCAAPNISAARKYQQVTEKENKIILRNRIRFVLDAAEENEVDILILGAFGCGVFGQEAYTVATYFKEELEIGKYHFAKIIFAVPGGNGNHEAFCKIFS